MMRTTGFAVIAVVFVAGCMGKELARIPMNAEGTKEANITVTAGKALTFWTYLDVADDGTLRASYDIDLVQGGAVKGHTSCNPFDVSVSTRKKELTVLGSRSVSYDGKMRCEIVPATSGPATARVTLKFATHPQKLEVKSMTLLIHE